MKKPIYLDYMATTPVDKRVKEKMIQYLDYDGTFGNPASSSHQYGWLAREAVEKARFQVAQLINTESEEIIWTSGATESNNLALKGTADFYSRKGKHIITSKTEHKAVLDTCKFLESSGYEVTYLSPKSNGLLDLQQLAEAIRPDTVLVSIMLVNNEIGVIQDVKQIAQIVKPHGIIFHVDAAQAAGKVPIDAKELGFDLASFSAHKVYGPKGIGALYVKRKPVRVRLTPQMHGGGHEFGMRSGTLATHQIVGMGEAFAIAKKEMESDFDRISKLKDRFLAGLADLDGMIIHGDLKNRIPNNLNFSFTGVKGDDLLSALKDLAISSGSACNSHSAEPSYVLKAIGVSNAQALGALRISFGRYTTEQEIDFAAKNIYLAVIELRK